MGPRSTAPFIEMVVTECQKQYGARDDIDFPKIMICSQPAPFYEDRPVDHDALEAAIRGGLKDLEATGADLLAIACNTAHVYYPSLAAVVEPPLLNMVELTADVMPAAARTIGLIAARPTVESGIYQRALAARGFTAADVGWQGEVDRLLGLTRASAGSAELADAWREIGLLLRLVGADTALIACLDLSAIRQHAPGDLPVVDAAECLASEVVRQWLHLRDS
ncbi:aspartate/glutamate racemase family protein [Streptomyces sp. NPDC060223]|uniref:aspartate/glutamate racemase family protein n=1 Tax=unclassified Streptomyces TaxID=2593676 RepID=UPI00362BF670